MTIKLQKLEDQTIVLTGATSGIGLVTARKAAARGAKLVLAARNEGALRKLCDEIREKDGEAVYVVADVGNEGDVTKIAAEALNQFGNFDTWINNAGVSIYGKLEDVSMEDCRRLFETNFWGVVYGSLVAARNLKMYGGALINIGSTLSDVSIPIQGMYCASKHAVKGFTDALRMELEAENAPISVTLIKPSATDTPYKQHAKNYLEVDPQNPPPIYAPELVANTILYAAENPVRDAFVGAGGKLLSMMGEYAPGFTDKLIENTMIDGQQTDRPAFTHSFESLYEPGDSRLKERGDYDGHVAESSLYTAASLHPTITGAVATGAALAFSAGLAYSIMKRNHTH
jgi:short-subunit dehydrogenase